MTTPIKRMHGDTESIKIQSSHLAILRFLSSELNQPMNAVLYDVLQAVLPLLLKGAQAGIASLGSKIEPFQK